ncbi:MULTISPECIES: hypothetical protein [Xenorhabdus]|uniref:hypothetical protein n=1 Tax=Xenorhabdus TaxID=626 RepID=UPI00064A5495|nr:MULTISPECIES: hypothetical protein [Xenorhabdus]KLU15124.1 hypothetical protein AAY47_12525 [Xenorhabdus griffiniae]KOP34121.1 hypothetical protein AFK69_06345 [Xenorhabdus sp. GDc328]
MFKFAHLLGTKARAADEHEDDEKARKAKSRAEEKEDETDAEDDDPDAEDEDDEKEGKKAKKAKKAKSEDDDPDAEDDDDDDADADENEDVKKGSRAERKRCAQIFGSKYAAGRPDMAAHLTFNTRMSASEAISTLKVMGSVQSSMTRVTLDSRMRAEQQVRLGPDAQQPAKGSAAGLAQQMTGLYNTNRGTK